MKRCNCGHSTEHVHDLSALNQDLPSLKPYIDVTSSSVMNVRKPIDLDAIILPSEKPSTPLISIIDPHIMVKIQFTASVAIKAIAIQFDNSSPLVDPSVLQAYVNDHKLDFSSLDAAVKRKAQEWSLVPSTKDIIYYPTRVFKFSNVHHLTLVIKADAEDAVTSISKIGVFGEFKYQRVGAVQTVFELKPNVADHPQVSSTMQFNTL